ncbi:MAG: N-acetylmuramoyl-L-alanine amidase [Deltaproteobacteria bacterium]|nr:MAG: N-acetylmuramoyl-L-alanine amidase [Deltaproteobacteria bacterium]TMA57389.1 MAG: N-acetylmuramoyl-L-alanine amidase [Deltaproteobacteria bacterium]
MEGWWRGGLAALAWLTVAGTAGGAQLTAVRAESGAGGATVRLSLSGPVRAAVHDVGLASGGVARVYVDLPRGTGLAPGVPRSLTLDRPPTRVRVGRGERGVVRVVLELGGAAGYRVLRPASGSEIVVSVALPHDAPADPVKRPEASVLARAGEPHSPKIVIDPGHGGHDPGAQGYAVEKEVTLAIAQRLAALLRERLGAETVLTRTDDETLSLADRTARANAEGADLFVSIHANANPSGRLHGIETYYLDNAADRATSRLAAMENGLDLLHPRGHGSDLRYILSDLVQVGKMDESIALARAVQRAVVATARSRYPYVTDLGVKRGPFYVLVGAYMPCVLIETSFLTHPLEGRRLARTEYQAMIADGVASGVGRFLADSRRARTL